MGEVLWFVFMGGWLICMILGVSKFRTREAGKFFLWALIFGILASLVALTLIP